MGQETGVTQGAGREPVPTGGRSEAGQGRRELPQSPGAGSVRRASHHQECPTSKRERAFWSKNAHPRRLSGTGLFVGRGCDSGTETVFPFQGTFYRLFWSRSITRV